ncbi:hypothetical protein ACFWAY_52425 [Rhodococcus sp. NPDC059968]|uniref:hypothetical protein n=1 Tax=Rhodococcus sp. NPDC059968 TaxID=3347017 RepID=UPI00366C4764
MTVADLATDRHLGIGGALRPSPSKPEAQGGRHLDCLDTVLPDLHNKTGCVAVARLRWNDAHTR